MRIIFFSSIGSFFRRFFATCQDFWYVPPKSPTPPAAEAPVAAPAKKPVRKRASAKPEVKRTKKASSNRTTK